MKNGANKSATPVLPVIEKQTKEIGITIFALAMEKKRKTNVIESAKKRKKKERENSATDTENKFQQ